MEGNKIYKKPIKMGKAIAKFNSNYKFIKSRNTNLDDDLASLEIKVNFTQKEADSIDYLIQAVRKFTCTPYEETAQAKYYELYFKLNPEDSIELAKTDIFSSYNRIFLDTKNKKPKEIRDYLLNRYKYKSVTTKESKLLEKFDSLHKNYVAPLIEEYTKGEYQIPKRKEILDFYKMQLSQLKSIEGLEELDSSYKNVKILNNFLYLKQYSDFYVLLLNLIKFKLQNPKFKFKESSTLLQNLGLGFDVTACIDSNNILLPFGTNLISEISDDIDYLINNSEGFGEALFNYRTNCTLSESFILNKAYKDEEEIFLYQKILEYNKSESSILDKVDGKIPYEIRDFLVASYRSGYSNYDVFPIDSINFKMNTFIYELKTSYISIAGNIPDEFKNPTEIKNYLLDNSQYTFYDRLPDKSGNIKIPIYVIPFKDSSTKKKMNFYVIWNSENKYNIRKNSNPYNTLQIRDLDELHEVKENESFFDIIKVIEFSNDYVRYPEYGLVSSRIFSNRDSLLSKSIKALDILIDSLFKVELVTPITPKKSRTTQRKFEFSKTEDSINLEFNYNSTNKIKIEANKELSKEIKKKIMKYDEILEKDYSNLKEKSELDW